MTNEKRPKEQKTQGKSKRASNASDEPRQNQGENANEANDGQVEKVGQGRPTKYKQEYCQMLIDHMEQGKSLESFVAVLYRHTSGAVRVCRKTLYNWMRDYPEFQEARDFGNDLSLDFWEEMGIENIHNPPNQFNTALYCFNMKNRHGWTDRVEQTHVGDADKPVHVNAQVDVKAMTEEQLKDFVRQETHGG